MKKCRFNSIALFSRTIKNAESRKILGSAFLQRNNRTKQLLMGNIAFTLCFIESRYDSLSQKANNKSKLLEYSKDCIFSSYSQNQIETRLYEYAKSINFIRYKYRNPSAHTNKIRRIDAEECLNLVLDVERLLKRMLDSFDS